MSDLLVSLEEKFADTGDEIEEVPVEEEESTEEPAEEADEPEESEEEPAEAPEEDESEEPTEDEEEVKKAGLRQADYTKKTQALAEERKKLLEEIEQEREQFSAKMEEFQEVAEWVRALHDPDTMEFELSRYFPDTVKALRDKWLLESQEESALTPRERDALARARELERQLKAKKQDEEIISKKSQKQAQAQKTAELRKTFNLWMDEVLKPAGLDQESEDHRAMVRERLVAAYGQTQWTKDTFEQAAKDVAKRLKIKAPVKKEAAKPKTPPVPKSAARKAPEGKKAKSKPKIEAESFFEKLRSDYDVI